MGFFDKLKEGLQKTKSSFTDKVDTVFKAFKKVDEELFEELEEALITADVGVETSLEIIDRLRAVSKEKKIFESDELYTELKNIISSLMSENASPSTEKAGLKIILVIGVNGVGKTTSIGKLAYKFKSEGKKVLLAAGDTFRAAAIDQLMIWADRSGVDIVKHEEGSDPASVVFDAVNAAKARGTDVLIVDTAGRLHNKKNLMEELRKILKVADREAPEATKETLLVLDATTGQNALSQAKLFGEIAEINGIILTKLDGTAKGGVVIAICNEQRLPVRYIGVGEGIDNLQDFSPTDFVEALF
ncbi:MAG: signal recognition particle-docking protein FtsY [Clostridia bacterium]|nr:signal recognition particle-docking protein FtsY [Clostridia bacterium]